MYRDTVLFIATAGRLSPERGAGYVLCPKQRRKGSNYFGLSMHRKPFFLPRALSLGGGELKSFLDFAWNDNMVGKWLFDTPSSKSDYRDYHSKCRMSRIN